MATTSTVASKSKTKAVVPQPAEMRLRIGDRVRLQSGGALMCVTGVRGNGLLRCAWFDERSKIQRAAFPEAALAIEPPDMTDDEQHAYAMAANAAANKRALAVAAQYE